MGTDQNGFVDGVSPPVRFSDLAPLPQTPGRMWDGHNALPWYHSMNAWALAQANVAFRDRGDVELVGHYRPYVIVTIDNLPDEFIELGIPQNIGDICLTYCKTSIFFSK